MNLFINTSPVLAENVEKGRKFLKYSKTIENLDIDTVK